MTQQHLPTIAAEATATNGSRTLRPERFIDFVSESLYWEKYYDFPDIGYEWNNGQLEEIPPSDYAKYMMYVWFLSALDGFLRVEPIARLIGLKMGFRMALPTKTTIRRPDLGVVLNSNPIPLGDHDPIYRGIFDICIESLSDRSQTEIDRDAIIKREEYAAAGVQEYYLLDERGIENQFYRLVRRGLYEPLPRVNGIVRSQVLPGFQFRVADLYEKPSRFQMLDDPVYNGFASRFYRPEHQRAEQTEARAEQERQRAEDAEARAEQEQQRAEHYAGLLRAAGLLQEATA